MAKTGVTEFHEFLDEGLAKSGDFRPYPFYSHEADVLFFYARDIPSYGKRLNSFITLILSTEDDSLVGIKLKSVKRILTTLERLNRELQVCVVDHKIKLGILLAIARVTPPEDPSLEFYESKLDEFDEVEIDKDQLCGIS